MNIYKHLHKVAVLSALVLYGFSATPANAAVTTPVATPAGSCVGDASTDCVTAVGHMSASVVTTLSINEARAVSFGNMAVTCANPCAGDGTFTLGTDGTRTVPTGTDVITLLHGADATGGPADDNSGGQAPGHYTVSTGDEGSATQVYISFADENGNFIDYSGESYYPAANAVTLTGPGGTSTFLVNAFTVACQGAPAASDVYGHYCATDDVGGTAGHVDVTVGATLKTDTSSVASYAPGKYEGTYNVMVSY